MSLKGRDSAECVVLSEAQVETYVAAGGTKCPYCGSPEIEASNQEIADDGTFTFDCECTDCLREWRELYKLVGIMPKKSDARVHGTSN
jgi:DNA-directed RNA polymerase subunit M/transcription elongation factor TFIIS